MRNAALPTAAPTRQAPARDGASRPVPIVPGLSPLAPRHDLILCDIWGVLHNGVRSFLEASDALVRFRQGGGRVVLVSNAPRPGDAVAAQLDGFAVPRGAYDGIVTSGDLTRSAVRERRGEVVYHLGPDRDLPIFEGLDVAFGGPDEADYVVCSGLVDDDAETAAAYEPILRRLRDRDRFMICANPDLVVERGERLIPCAGALALAYEEMGGEVLYAGKPHGPVYETALALGARLLGAPPDRERVLAVGDAIRTDIVGAARAGLPSVLVARGIHGAELGLGQGPLQAEAVVAWLDRQEAQPSAVMDRLVWA